MKAAVRRAPAVPELEKKRRPARMERRRDLRPARHLRVVVAVELAGVGLRGEAELLGLGLEAFLHLHEKGIGVCLGDESDDVGGV